MFEGVKRFIRRRFGSMIGNNLIKTITDVIGSSNVTSDRMMSAISDWGALYMDDAPWLKSNPLTLGLPGVITSEFARSVTVEMDVNITGSPMADYISEQFKKVKKDIRKTTEYACAFGGIVFKPYVDNGKIVTEIIKANDFYPTNFTADGKITGAYFIYRIWKGKKIYSRLERHELNGTHYVVTNKAYVSAFEESIGEPCSLSEVEEWKDIEPEVSIDDVDAPLFAYFKMPFGNTTDPASPLGVSVYSRAIDKIAEADKQFQRLSWEYEGGELAIDAAEEAFKRYNGEPVLPEGKERLFRVNNLDAATTKGMDLLKAWSPVLRDESFIRGLDRILIQIENACYLSRGTLSDPTTVEKTGTEIRIMKQRSAVAVKDTQASLEDAINDLIYAMYSLASLYELAPIGEYNTSFMWDDSILVDAETERARDQQEVVMELMAKYEYRMKWYGEDEETAKAKLEEMKNPTDDEILGFGREIDDESQLGKVGDSNGKEQ